MDEKTLTPLQEKSISHAVKKLYDSEKIVRYDLDLKKWKIKHLYKDSLWVQLLDEPDADTVMTSGGLIAVPISNARGLYRLGKVIKCGPDTKHAKEGEIIRFPQGVGQPYEQSIGGFKTWLLREDSVMAVVEFEGDEEELEENLKHIQSEFYK